ncbi:MAG TPA: alkaline phosphatase family protein [Candidatus Xenobia bacterium]
MQALTPSSALRPAVAPPTARPSAPQDSVGGSVESLRPFSPPRLPASPPSDDRGLVIVCVDGLSYPALKYGVAAGHMPNMTRLLSTGYQAKSFFPGLPCTTPASMTGFTQGANPIPAFRWYDKASGQFYSADSLTRFERGFEAPSRVEGQPGLLAKGTLHACLVSGGAPHATLSVDVTSQRYQEGGPLAAGLYLGGDIARFAVHHPVQFGHAMRLVGDDVGRNYQDRRGEPVKERVVEAVKGAGECLMGEVGTSQVVDDMKHNVPVTFIDLPANDAVGHEYGPFSKETMQALERVDHSIGQIAHEAQAPGHRGYELLFLSDHGQTSGTSFQSLYGESLKDVMTRLSGGEKLVEGTSGSLDNVYFADHPGQLQLSQIKPGVVEGLVAHPGVGLVIGREKGATVILGPGGKITVQNGQVTRTGQDVLASYDSPEDVVIQQLNRLAQLPNSGDLIVMGKYLGGATAPEQKVVTFEAQRGAHGGLGGPENQAILVTAPGREVNTDDITNPSQMYWVLRSALPADGRPA